MHIATHQKNNGDDSPKKNKQMNSMIESEKDTEDFTLHTERVRKSYDMSAKVSPKAGKFLIFIFKFIKEIDSFN